VETLRNLDLAGLALQGVPLRYERASATAIGPLAPHVLIGVDHIPTRWEVQRAEPDWLGVGATTHWSAMSSFHQRGLACAGCLHPSDDPNTAPIPTVAFVSFWAGLLLATYLARKAAGHDLSPREQYTYMWPLRPERLWRSPVATRRDCPVGRHGENVRAA